MPLFKVTFERVQYYTLDIEAKDADEACKKAEQQVLMNGVDGYYSTSAELELTDCWVVPSKH